MNAQTADQLTFGFVAHLPIVVQRHVGQLTSDAGLLPIRQFDQRWRYTDRLAACLVDGRADPDHRVDEMLRQRLYGILADYEDCNDHDDLRGDPVFKLVAGRTPRDADLASQPTLSRFENAIDIPTLQRLIDFHINTGVERLQQHHNGTLPQRVTLDLDPTDDPTHGHQQLSLYHGYYEQHQYFPMIISEPTTKHVFLAWLRPGTVHASLGADDDLMRVVGKLRAARPDVRVHARGDSGFGTPWMYECCEKHELTYTFGFASNPRLKAYMQPWIDRARKQYEQTGKKVRLFTCFSYKADTWDRWRTVVAKIEHRREGSNLRFVVTNLPVKSPEDAPRIYDDYIQRGESEQRIDELKNGLHVDRLSCHRFKANFWRLLLHVAAYNLLNALRDHDDVPEELRRAQAGTWCTRLIKVAATVVQTTRRVLVCLAGHWPRWPCYHALGQRALAG